MCSLKLWNNLSIKCICLATWKLENAAFLLCLTSKMACERKIQWPASKSNVLLFFLFEIQDKIQYNFDHCWMKGSLQTRLINTQIWTFSTIVVILAFSYLKDFSTQIDTRLQLWQNKKGGKMGKKNGNLWFCGIFSNIGSRPGPTLWLQLRPGECFPCQHTSLPVAEHSGSCGFGSRHPGSGPILLLPVLGRKPTVVRWGSQLHERGPRIWGPLGWIQWDKVKEDSIGLCPP